MVSGFWSLVSLIFQLLLYSNLENKKSRQSFQIIGRYFISEFQSPQFSLYEKNIVYRRSEFSSLFLFAKIVILNEYSNSIFQE
ncbi:hypothetical protein HX13_13495 [Chryseobacterium sp. P1-3]|nr:hypothetical protein HX13_13495 [Chryseobacterium sp. P1-3]